MKSIRLAKSAEHDPLTEVLPDQLEPSWCATRLYFGSFFIDDSLSRQRDASPWWGTHPAAEQRDLPEQHRIAPLAAMSAPNELCPGPAG